MEFVLVRELTSLLNLCCCFFLLLFCWIFHFMSFQFAVLIYCQNFIFNVIIYFEFQCLCVAGLFVSIGCSFTEVWWVRSGRVNAAFAVVVLFIYC